MKTIQTRPLVACLLMWLAAGAACDGKPEQGATAAIEQKVQALTSQAEDNRRYEEEARAYRNRLDDYRVYKEYPFRQVEGTPSPRGHVVPVTPESAAHFRHAMPGAVKAKPPVLATTQGAPPPVSEAVQARYRQFREALDHEASSWAGLSDEERRQARAALKARIVGDLPTTGQE
jgi:hypothetical protein